MQSYTRIDTNLEQGTTGDQELGYMVLLEYPGVTEEKYYDDSQKSIIVLTQQKNAVTHRTGAEKSGSVRGTVVWMYK